MLIRSGKIQFLFWSAFFSVFVFLWIAAVWLQIFVIPDESPKHVPSDAVVLFFLLYGLFALLVMGGTLVSVLVNNRFYRRFFGVMAILMFGSMMIAKSMYG